MSDQFGGMHQWNEERQRWEPEPIMTEQLVADLTYINYATNRDQSPDITPERWVKVYGPGAAAMEERYQRELKERKQADGSRSGVRHHDSGWTQEGIARSHC